jgi:pimeloyl-ACP methyl ester carboxylesterase
MNTFFQNPQKCEVFGHSIVYHREGKGETILFIHGITTYSFIWRRMMPYFVDAYDVIAVDLLGCGESDKPLNEDFSLKNQSVFIKEFTDKLGISKFHLVSHDVGGGIAQIFAVNYGKQLHSMTLINSVAYNFWPVQPIIAMRTPIVRQIAMASLDVGMFKLVIRRGMYHKSRLDEDLMDLFWKPMKTKIGRKGFLHFAKCLDNKNLTEIEDGIKQLKIPTLIIRGEADVYLSDTISNKLHEDIQNSELVKIETGGHFIQEDEAERISETIKDFIENQNDA